MANEQALPVVVVANKIIGDYEYELQKDEKGIMRSFCRLSDSPHHDLRRLPAKNLPDELKEEFAKHTGHTREQLGI
ncbi:hypothetical protein KGQ25_00510 [Patescibacteria group bacterium]|nr:hypothetical protein [Patescibacteria group bacterium]MDE2173243.1 hypothetical protein [Patescibacteria group bacterium]